jgi:hypothetical protein
MHQVQARREKVGEQGEIPCPMGRRRLDRPILETSWREIAGPYRFRQECAISPKFILIGEYCA